MKEARTVGICFIGLVLMIFGMIIVDPPYILLGAALVAYPGVRWIADTATPSERHLEETRSVVKPEKHVIVGEEARLHALRETFALAPSPGMSMLDLETKTDEILTGKAAEADKHALDDLALEGLFSEAYNNDHDDGTTKYTKKLIRDRTYPKPPQSTEMVAVHDHGVCDLCDHTYG